MLGDWSGMDKEKAKNYILNCQVCLIFIPLSFFYVFKKSFIVLCSHMMVALG